MENQKGVTLIALIVSIIVMLILVMVTITLVFDGGLVNKANEAKVETSLAAKNDANMINESATDITKAVYGKWRYLNPNPPTLTEGNLFGAIFNNHSMLISLPIGVDGMTAYAGETAIPIILIVDNAEAAEQTIYLYFYDDYTEETITTNIGIEASFGVQEITSGWYKVEVDVDEGGATVTSFNKVTDVLATRVQLGDIDDIAEDGVWFSSLSLTNMDNFVSKTPYTEE